ncbi:hypothetical protein L9F63_002368, partial [Diploptera punctata]
VDIGPAASCIREAISELISIVRSLWSTGVMSFLGAKKRHNTGRPEATDDRDKLRNCSIEEKGYEVRTFKNLCLNYFMVLVLKTHKKSSLNFIFKRMKDLQKKVYFLLDQLQQMARELPPKYQQRIPCELLSGLANALLNDTIFEIVKGLMEIQHVTEKHLFQQRLQLINKHSMEMQEMLEKTNNAAERQNQRLLLQKKHKQELKHTDMKLVLQLDQRVSDQQVTLEKAGVPGFFVTNNPLDIKLQMYLLDFILRLSKMNIPP